MASERVGRGLTEPSVIMMGLGIVARMSVIAARDW